jgi:hypothetical protein
MSEIPAKPNTMEVRRFQIAYKFEDQFFEGRTGPKGLDLKGGIISHLDVPENWKKNYNRRTRDLDSCDVPGDEVAMYFSYTGIPVGKDNIAHFKKLMAAPPHQLDANECTWVQHMLDQQEPSPGHILRAQTYDVDARRVLETRVKNQTNGNGDERYSEGMSLYTDISVPHLGHYLQKIDYIGNAQPFEEHENEARNIFKSIIWCVEYDFNVK